LQRHCHLGGDCRRLEQLAAIVPCSLERQALPRRLVALKRFESGSLGEDGRMRQSAFCPDLARALCAVRIHQFRLLLRPTTFIANSQNPNLLQEIYVAEQSYLKVMTALDLWNQFHSEIEKKYPPIQGTFDEEKVSGDVMASKFDIAKGNYYINELYKRVDLASPQLVETINKIADFAGKNFKGKKLFRIDEQIKTAKKEQAAS
jgi:hypothetical protein